MGRHFSSVLGEKEFGVDGLEDKEIGCEVPGITKPVAVLVRGSDGVLRIGVGEGNPGGVLFVEQVGAPGNDGLVDGEPVLWCGHELKGGVCGEVLRQVEKPGGNLGDGWRGIMVELNDFE